MPWLMIQLGWQAGKSSKVARWNNRRGKAVESGVKGERTVESSGGERFTGVCLNPAVVVIFIA